MRRTSALCLLVVLMLAGCGVENWTMQLPYAGPVEMGIDKGQTIPGTEIAYLGRTDDGAQVSIGGQLSTKKIGDSLDWRTDLSSKVSLDQTYRVALITENSLQVAGTVRIVIPNPELRVGELPPDVPIHFTLPVGYHIDKGEAIPGTTLTYLGKTESGARLGGMDEYPYRRVGDSIVWRGKIRDGVWIELVLRTALVTDSTLDVVGTAELWLVP